MCDVQIVDMTPQNIAEYGVCGYKDVNKHVELRKKIEWFEKFYPKGLRIIAIISEKAGYQGSIEYIPGEYAHRPVNAKGYTFIHCVFVGLKKEFKSKGYASILLDECEKDAANSNSLGVAVVTRKGSFMADDRLFLKKGYKIVDSAEPDFHLLVKKFDPSSNDPTFKSERIGNCKKYGSGLTVLRSAQCPYTEKNVNAILETAECQFGLKTELVELKDARAAQQSPCPFGTFGIVFNGELISHHPISNTRFQNIMKKILG